MIGIGLCTIYIGMSGTLKGENTLILIGSIVLLAQFLQPILTTSAINEITCAGSLLIVALGLNLSGVTKIKVANYLPAIIIAPVLSWVATLF